MMQKIQKRAMTAPREVFIDSRENRDADPVSLDDDTVETLLSEWNDDSDDEDSATPGKTREQRLKDKFALRDALLTRMSEGQDERYVAMLMHHEALVREEAFKLLGEKTKKFIAGTEAEGRRTHHREKGDHEPKTEYNGDKECELESKESASATPAARPSLIERIRVFESELVFPSLMSLLAYSSMHLALYEIVNSMVIEQTRWVEALGDKFEEVPDWLNYLFEHSEDVLHLGVIFLAFFIMRFTGGVWDWASRNSRRIAKFDLHNRIRLGYWDARLHLWFKKHRRIKFALNYFAIYLCLVGVAHFQYSFLGLAFRDREWILQKLPSRAYGVDTPVSLSLQRRMSPRCDEDAARQCTLMDKLNQEDEKTLEDLVSIVSVSGMLGFDGMLAATPLGYQAIYLITFLVSAFILNTLGYQWD